MKLTATEFRKSLFPLLERALHGEPVEVVYKGAVVKLVPSQSPSKLARAKRQHALLCDPDSIIHSDSALIEEMESQWRKDWGGM
ncbi:MAG: type II toxin-antitoxin system prevent-host-death family antitoxin [Bryobacteraceae bacterium]|jgi:prevent-host-death family protein